MQNAESLNPEQIRQFLELSEGVEFAGQSRAEIYAFVELVLVAQQYASLAKKQRGAVRHYLSKVTGLSLPQTARLIRRYRKSGKVQPRPYRRHSFATQYTDADVALLAEVDRAHERLSGPATRRILEREYQEFGKKEFQRLAGISVSISTICGAAHATAGQRRCSSRHGLRRYRSPSGASPTRKTDLASCGWTPCIRATGTAPRASTTSMRWTR